MPLHYVDPTKKHGHLYRAMEGWSRSRPGQFVARRLFPRIDPWLFRVTGGRYPWILGTMSTAPLVSTGAKSGLGREHQLTYFHDGPDPILIASNYGGTQHPQWYYNLKANPQCEFGDEPFIAEEVTESAEHARLFGLAEQVYSGYGDYRGKAAAVGRTVPVFRLISR
ncbi:nitroreductase/quinone reductase family protein [Mycolicibacterium stellerae]|uniref:nitroreductase/quinone reductase family protein n=1 Tax=Mycolicibacterium stellerae TaxID=2358193 RepID=UPI000F0B7FB6|nr:nitroreductase/quinone reductase family protein [Mycolicibacterium stellerae]